MQLEDVLRNTLMLVILKCQRTVPPWISSESNIHKTECSYFSKVLHSSREEAAFKKLKTSIK